jgi:FtsP/CotA-like multicopper oxidase with cupredoxin domain
MRHEHDHLVPARAPFPSDATGLPKVVRPDVVDLADGDSYTLRIGPVTKRLGDATVRMLGYNGSVPGPTLRVRQGSEIVIEVENDGDLEATVHWHGLRLDNRYDGTHQTQNPIPVGERFTYPLTFPDPGAYWYHPHIRQDYGQEMGLYGNILVVPAEPGYWPPVHRELLLTLDDLLLEDGRVAAFDPAGSTHTAMGRFGNVLLVSGEPDLALSAQLGEVVRLYLTNTANTRVFNVALPGARMKLVGGDSGRCERERFVESVILSPSERVVVDVLFDRPGELTLEHRTPERTYPLAAITVGDEVAAPRLDAEFETLRTDRELSRQRERIAPFLLAAPDKTLAFVAEMDMGGPDPAAGPIVFQCPMDPEVVRAEPGSCPKCGMKLLAVAAADAPPVAAPSAEPAHHGHNGHDHAHQPSETDGIEWEDDMVEVNRMTTPANMRWKLVDRATGAENHAIDWRFRIGDQVKIRLVNEMESDHPMHHPFHVHGAGRFLVLSRDGVPNDNLVWKDTVLLRTGETIDILLDVTHSGLWMAHCHIAEHHESGMMFSFTVTD